MSLQVEPIGPIPEETVRVARAALPRGNVYVQIRDALGPIYRDEQFASLFAVEGRPAEAPWRLALVTVMQFGEGLTDRQAAEAVRTRIDWKYVLGLDLTDPGFDHSVLCEFRQRLVMGGGAFVLLTALLEACRVHGYIRARGRQRTDATHVLGALRVLNRLERVGETLRSALNAVASVAPDWLRTIAPAEWFERYGRRIEESRLPRGQEQRQQYAQCVGADGMQLLAALDAPTAPSEVRHLPAVQVLRQIWQQQYSVVAEQVRLRELAEMPPAVEAIESPYETEARYAVKRNEHWTGYKLHVTETCDPDLPHLISDVQTTAAPVADVTQVGQIQARLATIDLLPQTQIVDAAYMSAENIVTAQTAYGIDLVGPVAVNRQWQATDQTGYAATDFQVDWSAAVVTCPQGHTSVAWRERVTPRGTRIHVRFARATCRACPVRAHCTRAATEPRSLKLRPHAAYDALQSARLRQRTAAFATLYAARAGVEGTLSQAVRACNLRHARYRGLAKTRLQHIATAAAINFFRLADWLDAIPPASTRRSSFAALAPAA